MRCRREHSKRSASSSSCKPRPQMVMAAHQGTPSGEIISLIEQEGVIGVVTSGGCGRRSLRGGEEDRRVDQPAKRSAPHDDEPDEHDD